MNSILNSISLGDLLVQEAPREHSIKEDSIMDLLQNSEIELDTCPKLENKLDNFNTGFGENNETYFETKCKLPELKVPLYLNNYLSEFVTEEEKAAARHSLGLYNKGDIVAMSLLTTKENKPSLLELKKATIKQMCLGDQFFIPITTTDAVLDTQGISLGEHLNSINKTLNQHQKDLSNIINVSNNTKITSLGDVAKFLQGFSNNDNLQNILDDVNQNMLVFDYLGDIR